jgi:hypothetical protein
MGLKDRLRRLEASTEVFAAEGEDEQKSRRALALYFKVYENARREQEGLPPRPPHRRGAAVGAGERRGVP